MGTLLGQSGGFMSKIPAPPTITLETSSEPPKLPPNLRGETKMGTETESDVIWGKLLEVLNLLKEMKGEERSPKGRYLSIVITQLEIVISYYYTMIECGFTGEVHGPDG